MKKHTTPPKTPPSNKTNSLTLQTNRSSVKLRDGEVVLFLRTDSEQWQCRYRLKDIGWVRRATRTRNLEVAIERACDWYDEARYRLRAGLAPEIKRIGDIARETVQEMHTEMALGLGKRIYTDYCSVIERYIVPYFKNNYITTVTARDIAEFEAWRTDRLGKIPVASKMVTFAAAWQRIQTTAINRGWVSQHTPIIFTDQSITVEIGNTGLTTGEMIANETVIAESHCAKFGKKASLENTSGFWGAAHIAKFKCE